MKKRIKKESSLIENSDSDHLDDIEDVQAPIYTAPDEVKRIIEQVWQLEKSRLDRKSFGHISDDILAIIKSVVQ
jgi:hypothetical protein